MPGPGARTLPTRYLALGRVDNAVRTISDATCRGCAEGAEMLCELAEKLVCSGHEPQARLLWQQARAGYPATSGSMSRLASGTATSAPTPEPWNG